MNGSGRATFSTSALSVSGSPHSITAVYGGDSSFAGITSNALSQTIIDLSASTTTIVSSKNPAEGLVLQWELNESSGTTASDSSGNGYTGTIEGNPFPTWITGVDATNVISFESAGGYVSTTGNVSQMGNAQRASMSGWAYLASTSDTYAFGFTKTAGYRFELLWDDSILYGAVESGGKPNYPFCAATATGWHFVALTFDGTKAAAQNRVAIYLDGVAQPLTPAGYGNPTSLDTAANLSDFYLAADFGNTAVRGGAMANVSLYSETLTPAQVATIYNAGPR